MKKLDPQILPKIKNFSFKHFYHRLKADISYLYHVTCLEEFKILNCWYITIPTSRTCGSTDAHLGIKTWIFENPDINSGVPVWIWISFEVLSQGYTPRLVGVAR